MVLNEFGQPIWKSDRIVPLSQVHPARDERTRRRDAREGRVPGAIQFRPGGRWWVDLDAFEAAVREGRP